MHPASPVNLSASDQQRYHKIIYGFVDRPCCPECHEVLKSLNELDQQRNEQRNEAFATRRCPRCQKKVIPIVIKIIEPINLRSPTEYRKN